MRNSLDNTVPAKVTRCNLKNEILQIIRLHQLYRHTALTRAHTHWQTTFLVQVSTGQGHCLPSTGRQRTNGHIGENQRINPIYWRSLGGHNHFAILHLERQLLGRQNTAKWGTNIKGMTSSIQRWVCHLRNTTNNNAIQSSLGIQIGTATTLNRACILGKESLSAIWVPHWMNSIIRTNLFTHTAATAEISKAGYLLNNRAGNMSMLWLWLTICRNYNGLSLGFYLDGLEGTAGYTAAAHSTSICMIFNFPGKVIYRNILCLYCFHLCTSSSLSITITSRSFG